MSLRENLGPIVSSNTYISTCLLPYQNHFKAAHWNCRSISPSSNSVKFNELKPILGDNIFDVFAVSETWLNNGISDRAIEISGYKLWRNDRVSQSRGGGVGLYMSMKIEHKFIFKVSSSNCESLFHEIIFNNATILFDVVYLPLGDLVTFEQLHNDLFLEYSNIVVVGDFNCNLLNSRMSELFRSLCLQCNMSLVRNSKPTHFDLGKKKT